MKDGAIEPSVERWPKIYRRIELQEQWLHVQTLAQILYPPRKARDWCDYWAGVRA